MNLRKSASEFENKSFFNKYHQLLKNKDFLNKNLIKKKLISENF